MNRTTADIVAGALVVSVLGIGLYTAWDAYQQAQAFNQMGMHMDYFQTVNPIWYFLGGVLVASVIGGVYVYIRSQVFETPAEQSPSSAAAFDIDGSESENDADLPPSSAEATEAPTVQRTLDLLPEDERKILEPVLDSPGLTQIELRDRSNFSKSKVSQTVTDLEKRGLLYREPQGRTYRVYPSDEVS